MKILKEYWCEMDVDEKRECIGQIVSWAGLMFLVFMGVAIGG